jgi:hypothetical protein
MAITQATMHYNSGFSIQELEEALENDERTTRCKVQSLELGENERGEKATIAEFKKTDKKDLGKLKVVKTDANGEQGELFHGDAYILTQHAKVSVSRPD